jgi:hypothetical protein
LEKARGLCALANKNVVFRRAAARHGALRA